MQAPRRIVSLVPSHTESLHGLGLADRVVGRTRFCVHPKPWVDGLPVVGGTKDARLDRILALQPDLVVADKDENPKALVDGLLEAGVRVVWSDIATVADAAAFLERLGRECGGGAGEAGRAAARRIRDAVAGSKGGGRPVPVFCPIWHDPWMAFDGTSYPHDVLASVGLRNVFAGHAGTRYFEVTPEEVRAAGPEWTLLPTEPFPFHRRRDAVDTGPLGPAGRPERVVVVDGEALTWFGTRTEHGLRELAAVARRLREAP